MKPKEKMGGMPHGGLGTNKGDSNMGWIKDLVSFRENADKVREIKALSWALCLEGIDPLPAPIEIREARKIQKEVFRDVRLMIDDISTGKDWRERKSSIRHLLCNESKGEARCKTAKEVIGHSKGLSCCVLVVCKSP